MTSITLSIATSLLVVTLLTSVGHFVNTSLAQDNMTAASNNTGAKMGNQTNQTGGGGGQQNQTGIGTASQMENLTSGNTGLLQNASDIGSQNTSVTGGMEQEQEATETTSPASTQQQGNQTGEAGQAALNETGEAAQTAMNETGEALTNASKSDVAQNISQGGQEIGQTVANETGDIFGSISEGLKGLIGGGSQSK
ncbi:MAG: hypothetical protein WCE99_03500 [Nitrososphaeraceae archaeon]